MDITQRSAVQQPQWSGDHVLGMREVLMACPALVTAADVRALRSALGQVAAGRAHVLQAGDCAEDPAECTAGCLARKVGLLDLLAGVMELNTSRPVVRVGRVAGQFAKPRSRSTERVGGAELPVYRGHMVNSPEPDPDGRRADASRLVHGYRAASDAMRHLGWDGAGERTRATPYVWTSHEALLLDYEIAMLRRDGDRMLLGSTHWPWIGDRTRQVDGAHVALLAGVTNPVACKVGPRMAPGELLELCDRLDPGREPGRLTLIARMGADAVADLLGPLVEAVRGAGHPVIWLTDPMHGNTVTTPDGLKTRVVRDVVREVRGFAEVVGGAGGIHLEATPDDVTECAWDSDGIARVGEKYTSLCDPRLNPRQAVRVVSAWA